MLYYYKQRSWDRHDRGYLPVHGSQASAVRLRVEHHTADAETGVDLGLEVRARGERLTDPHVATAHVASRGRRDIRKDAFDGPIQLHFRARIVGILETSCITKVPGTP